MKKFLVFGLMIMIAAVGVFFTACGYTKKDVIVTASYSGMENGYLSLVVGQQARVEFTVAKLPKKSSARLIFSKNSNSITTPVLDSYDENTGKTTVTFTALAKGEEIYLRAIADGGNFYELRIKVSLPVTDFTLKSDVQLFAVRGTTNPKILHLDSSIFNFYPSDTSQKDIIFQDSNGNEITQIDANDFPSVNQISVRAVSPHISKFNDLTITLINEIGSVNTFEKGEINDIQLIAREQATSQNPQTDILFITNRSALSRKTIRVIVSDNTNSLLRVNRNVISQTYLQCSDFDISKTYQEDGSTIFEFELQSLLEGSTTISFDVYYLGYESYKITRTLEVIIKSAPDQIRMNDITQQDNVTQILFDGAYSTVYSTQYLSIIPTSAIYDRIEVSYDLDNLKTPENPNPLISDYISFTVGGNAIGDKITNLTSPIVAKGVKTTNQQIIYLVIKVFWGEQYGINQEQSTLEYRLAFEVKTGASALLIKDNYNSIDGLYLENNGSKQTFAGLYVANAQSYTENITIYPISQGAGLYAKVEALASQSDPENGKIIPLDITPLSVGTGKWRILLPNGVYRDITINVITQVSSFKLDFNEYASSLTSIRQYDAKGNLSKLGVKLTKSGANYTAFIQLRFLINPSNYNFANTKLFEFTRSPASIAGSSVTFDNTTNVLTVSTDFKGFSEKAFDYLFIVKKVRDFKLIDLDDLTPSTPEYADFQANNVFAGSLNIEAYVPLTKVSFSQNEVSLYSNSQLGLNYKEQSNEQISLVYTPNNLASLFDDIMPSVHSGNIKIELTSSKSYYLNGNTIYIDNYGNYDFETGILTVDVQASTYDTFYIYARVTYYNEIYTASLKVTPKFYQTVNEVYLSNYLPVESGTKLPYINLSPTHSYQEIFTYISPENAVHKDLRYTFEPDLNYSGSLVKIEATTNNGIRIIYNNEYQNIANGGSGTLYISPLASIIDTSSYPDNSLKIRIYIGAGTENNPFAVSTAQELLNIGTSGNDKHYVITNIIDLSNVNFSTLGAFSGSIDGKGIGKIIGLNITKQIWNAEKTKTYAGLFTQINAPGIIKNLIIEGSINLTAENKGSIGLVAGELEQGATLQNVTVLLSQSTVSIATDTELVVGGVVGVNRGTIKNYVGINPVTNAKYVNYPSIVMNGRFTMSYTLQRPQAISYFGGIAGVNEGIGLITRITASNVKVYNNDNYTAVVNMKVEGAKNIQNTAEQLRFSIGAISGKNASRITASRFNPSDSLDSVNYYDYIKATGKIDIVQADNKLGGLVGDNLGVNAILEYAVSRVQLIGTGTGKEHAFMGGLFAYNENGTVQNSLIQALEDGVSLGVNASLIYSPVFGFNQGENPTLNGRVNIYGYDSLLLALMTVPATGKFSTLKSQTYIGAVEESGVFPEGKRRFVAANVFATFNNYYGDFLVGNDSNALREMFTPINATLVSDPSKTKNKMTSPSESVNMAYLPYYKTVNSQLQEYIADRNIYDFPFDFSGEINLYSFDPNIISIGIDGKLTVRSTGLVKIRILSSLNAKISQDVLIYVVKAANNFSLYIQNVSDENEINAGRNVNVYSGRTVPLIVQYYYVEQQKIGGKYIEFELAEGYSIYNAWKYESGDVKHAELIKIGSLYGFEAINGKGSTEFSIYANLQISYGGEVFKSANLKNEATNKEAFYNFIVSHTNGATAIRTNFDQMTIEPNDTFSFNFLTYTDDFKEELNLLQTAQKGTNIISGNYFNIFETNRIYKLKISDEFPQIYYQSVSGGELTLQITQKNLTDNSVLIETLTLIFDKGNGLIKIVGGTFADSLSLSMSEYFTIISGKTYNYEFKVILQEIGEEMFDDMLIGTSINSYIELISMQTFYTANFTDYQTANYQGTYYVNATAGSTEELDLKITSTITLDILTQTVSEIIVDSFAGSQREDINSGHEQFNYIDPQSKNPNHMRISVYPSFADYDYITIVNETSSVTTLFTLINENGTNKAGAVLVSNGIKISKADITGNLYVKYAAGSTGAVNGQVLVYSIKAYKNNAVVYTTAKYITVRFTKDVTFEIEGRQVATEDTTIYLTRGSTYNFTISSNGYMENEIYITASRADIISINKTGRTIQVLTNFTYQDVTRVEISIYGRKTVNSEIISSSPYTQEIIIVDYYILPSGGFNVLNNGIIELPTDSYTPVKNGSNGIVSVGLGNSYNIETEFLRGITIEYNPSVAGILTSLATFQNRLNTQAVWEYQIGSLTSEGKYSYTSNWTRITGSVAKTATGGNFTITKTDSGYLFTPLKVTSVSNPAYIFRLTFGYDYQSGLAVLSSNQNVKSFEFIFNVYQLSSIDTPTPVYTAEEFSAMNEGVYYILMDNITLPSTFTPITNAIAGLDGNGKKIIISNNLSVSNNLTKVGIFSSISKNALVRNLTIEIATTTRLTINQTAQSSIYAGLLAGENNGIITNVNISSQTGASFRIVFATELVGLNNYVGALVGLNNGYITNSRVVINLTSSANMSGFVSYNIGKISSSYVDKSLIINTSSESQNKTAGFVVYNAIASANGGKIINSYISGLHTGTLIIPVYANDTSCVLRSSTEVAGFVYENNGEITNAYSDIPIQTSSKSAGFVYLNKGTISYSYSTSMLKGNSNESYGFVYDNNTGTGKLKNNYFLKDADVNYSLNNSNNTMNTDLLKPLTKLEFSSTSSFTNFIFTNPTEFNKGIWFMPALSYESQFNNTNKTFIVGKPELVSANLIAKSEFVIDIERTIKDEVTGEVTYYYKNTSSYAQGSMYNPYIISTALELENTIKNSSSGNLNSNNFRIIADIDYEELVITSSKLYNTVIIGDIEGNGMEIRGYIIDSSVSTSSSGLFSKIGNGTSDQGSVKNLTLKPKYINMPNSTIVGGFAGTLDSGIIFNIKMNGFTYSTTGIVILGKNMVGGVIGRAIGSYKMINIESSISTNATYRSPYTLGDSNSSITSYFLFRSHVVNTLSKLSYSGSVVAVAAGTGQISNVTVSGLIASMSEFASLVFGGVGDGVAINNVSLSVVQGQFVQAAVYGGLVAGEFYGRMSNVAVSGANEVTDIFKVIPFVPKAVGGLVGLMGSSNNLTTSSESKLGGRIENAKVNVSIKSTTIKIVGGLVGELIGGRIIAGVSGITDPSDFITSLKSVAFYGSLQSEEVVGGIIGQVSYKPSASISHGTTVLGQGFSTNNTDSGFTLINGASVTGGTIAVVNENSGHAYAGGLIGKISLTYYTNANLKIENAYSTSRIKIFSDIFGSIFNIYAGGLVGKLEKINLQISSETKNSSLTIKTSYFSGTIALSLRDLKDSIYSKGLLRTDHQIHYGKIISDHFENTKCKFTVEEENIFYKNNTTNNTGTIPEIDNGTNYLLLKYMDGSMKSLTVTETEQVFKKLAMTNESEFPAQLGDYGFDFVNTWIIKGAGQLPVLRFE